MPTHAHATWVDRPSPCAPPALQDSHTALQDRCAALQARCAALRREKKAKEAGMREKQEEKMEEMKRAKEKDKERGALRGKAEEALRELCAAADQFCNETDAETRASLRRMIDTIQVHSDGIYADIAAIDVEITTLHTSMVAISEDIARVDASVARINARIYKIEDMLDGMLDSIQGVCQRSTFGCARRSASFIHASRPALPRAHCHRSLPPLPAVFAAHLRAVRVTSAAVTSSGTVLSCPSAAVCRAVGVGLFAVPLRGCAVPIAASR